MNNPLVIYVDRIESPSQTLTERGVEKPAWVARVHYGPEDNEYVEAISMGGPGLAIDFALTIMQHKLKAEEVARGPR